MVLERDIGGTYTILLSWGKGEERGGGGRGRTGTNISAGLGEETLLYVAVRTYTELITRKT